MKRWSVWLRVLVAAAGVAVIVWTVQWGDAVGEDGVVAPGVGTMLRGADWARLGLAWLIALPVVAVQGVRWWLLMRCRDLDVPLRRAQRLTWAGMFFNFCLPGATGGDLIKAGVAAKGGPGKAAAIVSIGVDRIAGMVGLVLLGAVGGLFVMRDPAAAPIARAVWVGLGVLVVCGVLYLTPALRKWLGVGYILARAPGGGVVDKLDRAALAYRHHAGTLALTVLISIGVHSLLTLSMAQCGYALGMTTPLSRLFVVVPVLLAASALPLTYQGLGVMEGLGVALLVADTGTTDATVNQVVGMLVLFRFVLLSFGLLGSLALLGGGIRLQEDGSNGAEGADGVSPPPAPGSSAAPVP